MSTNLPKPVSLAAALLVGGMGLSGSAFAITDLAQGYMVAAGEAAKTAEGKCGEGKCGIAKMDTDKDGRISMAEFSAAHGGDGSRFAAHDPDQDGFISAAELMAHHADKAGAGAMMTDKAGMEGKCGEGRCGAAATKTDTPAKAASEGKCGEGKCGAGMMKTGTPPKAATEGKCGEGKCGGAA